MSSLALVFCASCVAALAVIPLLARLSQSIRLVDRPDGRRKLHGHEIALCGGIGCFLVSATVATIAIRYAGRKVLLPDQTISELLSILVASTVLLIVGIIDDAVHIRGRQKLAGQVAAALILVAGGMVVHRVEVFGSTVEFGPLAAPLTVVWIVGAINAMNLLDGLNGFAGSIGIINAAALAYLAQRLGHPAQAIVAASMAGSLLGFLRYNFPRATVFLGDAGSMVVGLVLGALAIQSSLKATGTMLLTIPICMLAIPFFDSAAAITRRKLTGRSIFATDRSHMHHRLAERFGSVAAVAIVTGACALLGMAAMTSVITGRESVAVISVGGLMLAFVASRVFGHSELGLVRSRLSSLIKSFFMLNRGLKENGVHSASRLQGNRQWEKLWLELTEAVQDLPVTRMELDVNCPALHEGYHGAWKRHVQVNDEKLWRFDMPLISEQHAVGHVRFFGIRSESMASEEMEKLLFLLDEFEGGLGEVLRDDGGTAVKRPATETKVLVGPDDTEVEPAAAEAESSEVSAVGGDS